MTVVEHSCARCSVLLAATVTSKKDSGRVPSMRPMVVRMASPTCRGLGWRARMERAEQTGDAHVLCVLRQGAACVEGRWGGGGIHGQAHAPRRARSALAWLPEQTSAEIVSGQGPAFRHKLEPVVSGITAVCSRAFQPGVYPSLTSEWLFEGSGSGSGHCLAVATALGTVHCLTSSLLLRRVGRTSERRGDLRLRAVLCEGRLCSEQTSPARSQLAKLSKSMATAQGPGRQANGWTPRPPVALIAGTVST